MSTSNRNIEQYPAEARRSQDFSRQQPRRGHTGTLYQHVTEKRVKYLEIGIEPINRLLEDKRQQFHEFPIKVGQHVQPPWMSSSAVDGEES